MVEINSLSDAIDVTKNIGGNLWFRGHSDISYKLIPSVLRNMDGKLYDESRLIKEFIRRNPEAKDKHNNILELLTYAQHYGLPTRLLDWTENLLVALYFACSSKNHKDGNLFILDSKKRKFENFEYLISNIDFWETLVILDGNEIVFSFLSAKEMLINKIIELQIKEDKVNSKIHTYFNDLKFDEIVKIKGSLENHYCTNDDPVNLTFEVGDSISRLNDSIFLYQPPMINKRLISQAGCFTIHTGKYIYNRDLIPTVDAQEACPEMIKSYTIPATSKENILYELRMCGIHHSTIFPELEYLTADIKSYCMF
ncbi:FRG domain-containing protein [Shewanella dokdonensis]|uniref:FRG domain-containing protein n=1 Tax=Shewanella dokdonensis TaxID=712036 RepID=A0ABX8DBR4_9GAMM|nr:FRG domain-containing protein [Shewanella dokdonensis]MCL1074756.1 FRG domain-containing protein [Shewanella dokdonensis]QVK22262.1 FRG domain-containing protein [Shewanella dokdonensis]